MRSCTFQHMLLLRSFKYYEMSFKYPTCYSSTLQIVFSQLIDIIIIYPVNNILRLLVHFIRFLEEASPRPPSR